MSQLASNQQGITPPFAQHYQNQPHGQQYANSPQYPGPESSPGFGQGGPYAKPAPPFNPHAQSAVAGPINPPDNIPQVMVVADKVDYSWAYFICQLVAVVLFLVIGIVLVGSTLQTKLKYAYCLPGQDRSLGQCVVANVTDSGAPTVWENPIEQKNTIRKNLILAMRSVALAGPTETSNNELITPKAEPTLSNIG